MPNKIEDEFTGKGTAAWRYQMRHRRDSKCLRCPRAADAPHVECIVHREMRTDYKKVMKEAKP